jgi:hypothetical protein
MAMQADPGGIFRSAAARADSEQPRKAQATPQGIGAPLEEIREKLVAIVDRLDGMLGEHAAPLLMEAGAS